MIILQLIQGRALALYLSFPFLHLFLYKLCTIESIFSGLLSYDENQKPLAFLRYTFYDTKIISGKFVNVL